MSSHSEINIFEEYNMGNWKEAKRIRDVMLKAEVTVIDGKYYPPIHGKGYIYDKYSCDCGFTDKSSWKALYHGLRNLSHSMTKNW